MEIDGFQSTGCSPPTTTVVSAFHKSQYLVIEDVLKTRRLVVAPKAGTPLNIGVNEKDEAYIIPGDDETAQVWFAINLLLEGGGTWLIPKTLPCLMDGKSLSGPIMLTNGATIIVRNRYFRYIINKPEKDGAKKRRQLPQTPGVFAKAKPPSKPGRLHTSSNQSKTEGPDESDSVKSIPLIPSYGDELLSHMKTPQEVVNGACEFVSNQVMCKTDLMMSSDDLDSLFRYMHEISENSGAKLFFDFVLEYNNQQKKLETLHSANHTPVIWLMTELLKVSLEPVEHHIMWLRVLNTFSHFAQNIPAFVEYQTNRVILGTMTAHPGCAKIHEYACCIMAQLAQYLPKPGNMVQLKSSGVELVIRSMTLFPDETVIVRPALRSLSNAVNILQTLLSESTIKDEATDVIKPYQSTFEFMQEKCPKPVKKISKRHANDQIIQMDIKRLLGALKS